MSAKNAEFTYEVAFSFAGAQRETIHAVAKLVAKALGSKKRVFYDEWYGHLLNGVRVRGFLQDIYLKQSRLVVQVVSVAYNNSGWCKAEAEAIEALSQDLSTRDGDEHLRLAYISFDDHEKIKLLPTIITWDGRQKTIQQLATLIIERLDHLSDESKELFPSNASTDAPTKLLVHPPTNDRLYSCRHEELAWLDECASDLAIRTIIITGIGGLGKTSLVGHWIQDHRGWRHRKFRGIFFFSFYSNRSTQAFFTSFIEFTRKVEGAVLNAPELLPRDYAISATRAFCFLVVLDGLEVLQLGEDMPNHGGIADGDLNEFVARVTKDSLSLLILTSRFSFPYFTRSFSDAVRSRGLPLLKPEEGAALLTACKLEKPHLMLEAYSREFDGHPLALRLFAGACKEAPLADPDTIISSIRSCSGTEYLPDPNVPGLAEDEKQKRRQQRQLYQLLAWYLDKLLPAKRALVTFIALFQEPADTDSLIALARGVKATQLYIPKTDRTSIQLLLEDLVADHLLQKEPATPGCEIERWSVHPVVREGFRKVGLDTHPQLAPQFAEILAGKGEGPEPKTLAELQPILEAIEVLLAAEEFNAAHALYQGRLKGGFIFQSLIAPLESLRCARSFVESSKRIDLLKKKLGLEWVAFYLNALALARSALGETEGVEEGYKEIVQIYRTLGRWGHVSGGFRNLADDQTLRGEIWKAISSASEALLYAGERDWRSPASTPDGTPLPTLFLHPAVIPVANMVEQKISRAYRAQALSLAGHLPTASNDFVKADLIERRSSSTGEGLYSIRCIQWSRHRQRLGEIEAAKRQTLVNSRICQAHGWQNDLIRCDLLLGEIALAEGQLAEAARLIGTVLKTIRDVRQWEELPDALLAMARLRRSQALAQLSRREASDIDDSALTNASEALHIAQRSRFRLKQCDILNFLSILHREVGDLRSAYDVAYEALKLASECDYYWGRHEAQRQLIASARSAKLTDKVRSWTLAEQELASFMQPLIVEARSINHKHDQDIAMNLR